MSGLIEKLLDKQSKGHILIIKPGAIGDVLQMTPVLRAVRNSFPSSVVLFLAGSVVTLELLYKNININEVLLFKKGRGVKEVSRVIKLAKSLKPKQIYMILNFQPSNWRWRLLTLILKPQYVFLYKKQKRINEEERRLHAVEDHLKTLSKFKACREDLHLDFFLTEDEIEEAKGIINGYIFENNMGKGIICFNMGASHSVNRWPADYFYKLSSILIAAGFRIILIGGEEDRMLVNQYLSNGPSECLDLVGKLSIRKTAAILSQCDLLVSGDTGPLHIATSVGTKVIGLFGAADPARTGPIGYGNIVIQPNLPCVPCRKRRCKNTKRLCMEVIKPEEVASKIFEIFSCDMPE
ncbi:MAG: glycosyltransferase family 9 protein [bacterium]